MVLGRLLISFEDCVFTAPWVPTGKKQGVVILPRLVCNSPVLADVLISKWVIVKKDFNSPDQNNIIYQRLFKAEISSSITTFKIAAIGIANNIPIMPPTEAPNRTRIITNIG